MDWTPFLTVGGVLGGGLITVFGTLWVARGRMPMEIGQSITDRFDKLTDRLQKEGEAQADVISELRQALQKCESRLRVTERHVARLERIIEAAGMVVPPFPLED